MGLLPIITADFSSFYSSLNCDSSLSLVCHPINIVLFHCPFCSAKIWLSLSLFSHSFFLYEVNFYVDQIKKNTITCSGYCCKWHLYIVEIRETGHYKMEIEYYNTNN